MLKDPLPNGYNSLAAESSPKDHQLRAVEDSHGAELVTTKAGSIAELVPTKAGSMWKKPLTGSITPNSLTIFQWGKLSRGDLIEVLDNDLVISRGVVDDFSPDRQVIWLQLSYGRGRRMFHQQDGWELRLVREAP